LTGSARPASGYRKAALRLRLMMNDMALVVKLIEYEADKRQADRPPSLLLRQFPALGLRDVNGV